MEVVLGFLLLIGITLIAEDFGAHVLKGCICAAMNLAALIDGLNMPPRRTKRRKTGASDRPLENLTDTEEQQPIFTLP